MPSFFFPQATHGPVCPGQILFSELDAVLALFEISKMSQRVIKALAPFPEIALIFRAAMLIDDDDGPMTVVIKSLDRASQETESQAPSTDQKGCCHCVTPVSWFQ